MVAGVMVFFFQGTSKEFAKFAEQLVTFLGQIWPAWYYLQGIVAPGRRANAVERAGESSSRELM